jgi:alpha-mannosidase
MPEPTSFVDLRIRRFLSERITPAIYREREPLTVTAWDVPGEPVPYAEAVTQEFRPFTVGEEWSRPWGTTWFHLTGTVPADWTTEGTALDLGFVKGHPGFQAEGLVWDTDGNIVKAVEPFNNAVPLSVRPGDTIDLYVEAASNPDVQGESIYAPTELGDLATSGDEPLYRTRVMDIGLRDIAVWELAQDIWTLDGLWRELGEELPRRAEILRGLERAIDVVGLDGVAGTAPAARRSRHCSPHPPTLRPTASSRSATRTSTRRGCGPCARRSASAPAPSPTCSPSWTRTTSSSSPARPRSSSRG